MEESKNQERRIIEEHPFPDDLEGRLNAVLNVINTELKSATLLHLEDQPRTPQEIHSRIKSSSRLVQIPCFRSFLKYCQTLLTIGMVTKEEIIDYENGLAVIGYGLTKAGEEYGQPIAAFALKYAVDNGMSLFSVFGSTASAGKSRSPLNRIKILEALLEKPLREADLIKRMSLPATSVFNHLLALQDQELLQFNSAGQSSNFKDFKYKWSGKKDCSNKERPVKRCTNLTSDIVDLFYEEDKREMDCHEVAKEMRCSSYTASRILTGLVKQGFLDAEWTGGERLTNIQIKEKGKRFVGDFIFPIKKILYDQNLEEIQEFYKQFSSNTQIFWDYISQGIQNYSSISPRINSHPKQETYNRIIDYLKEHNGSRTSEIFNALNLSNNPTNYLTPIIKSGQIRRERSRNKTCYYLNE